MTKTTSQLPQFENEPVPCNTCSPKARRRIPERPRNTTIAKNPKGLRPNYVFGSHPENCVDAMNNTPIHTLNMNDSTSLSGPSTRKKTAVTSVPACCIRLLATRRQACSPSQRTFQHTNTICKCCKRPFISSLHQLRVSEFKASTFLNEQVQRHEADIQKKEGMSGSPHEATQSQHATLFLNVSHSSIRKFVPKTHFD